MSPFSPSILWSSLLTILRSYSRSSSKTLRSLSFKSDTLPPLNGAEKYGIRAHEECSSTIRRIMLTLLAVSLFCSLTILSNDDSALIASDEGIAIPFANVNVSFVSFLFVTPLLLLSLLVYLYVFLAHLQRIESSTEGKIPLLAKTPTLFNIGQRSAYCFSLLIFYALVPVVLLLLTYRTLPRADISIYIGLITALTIFGLTLVSMIRTRILDIEIIPIVLLLWTILVFVFILVLLLVLVLRSLGSYEIANYIDPFEYIKRPFNVSGKNLEKCSIKKVAFFDAKFENTNLSECTVSSSDLTGASFRNSILENAKFGNVILQNADFENANLKESTFSASNLTGAFFRKADLTGTNFSGRENVFRQVIFDEARFVEADLSRADFTESSFRDTMMKNSDLSGATLVGSDFHNADLEGANLRTGHPTFRDTALVRTSIVSAKVPNNWDQVTFLKEIERAGANTCRVFLGENEVDNESDNNANAEGGRSEARDKVYNQKCIVKWRENSHYYQLVSDYVGDSVSWSRATRIAKNSRHVTPEGVCLQGYLLTLTSEEEQEFVYRLFGLSRGVAWWLGASDHEDSATAGPDEGIWRWINGPEEGQVFWRGGAYGDGGHPVKGRFSSWRKGEPNDDPWQTRQSGRGEDAALTPGGAWGNGWNDAPIVPDDPNRDPIKALVVVEYGGIECDAREEF